MSYRAGIGSDPRIVCDECGNELVLPGPRKPAWLGKGQSAPGWGGQRNEDGKRTDTCPECLEGWPT